MIERVDAAAIDAKQPLHGALDGTASVDASGTRAVKLHEASCATVDPDRGRLQALESGSGATPNPSICRQNSRNSLLGGSLRIPVAVSAPSLQTSGFCALKAYRGNLERETNVGATVEAPRVTGFAERLRRLRLHGLVDEDGELTALGEPARRHQVADEDMLHG
jgi:hypothetical protein